MTKREEVQKQLKELSIRALKLRDSQSRLNVFNGFNDGNFLEQNKQRLKIAEQELEKFKEDNLEYIL